jgi:hypothetical protein
MCKRRVSEGGATAVDTHCLHSFHIHGKGAVPRLLSQVRHSSACSYQSGGNVAAGGVDGGRSKL